MEYKLQARSKEISTMAKSRSVKKQGGRFVLEETTTTTIDLPELQRERAMLVSSIESIQSRIDVIDEMITQLEAQE
jgi:hypothetical protein